jgi:hypothetical protein
LKREEIEKLVQFGNAISDENSFDSWNDVDELVLSILGG